jgi:hypothetical protein
LLQEKFQNDQRQYLSAETMAFPGVRSIHPGTIAGTTTLRRSVVFPAVERHNRRLLCSDEVCCDSGFGYSVIPAQAGIQIATLDSSLRGNDCTNEPGQAAISATFFF